MQTLGQIAQNLGVTTQTLRNWKADAEADLGHKIEGRKHPTDSRKTVYDSAAVALITRGRTASEPAEQPKETVEAEFVSEAEVLGSDITIFQPGGLTTRVYDKSITRQNQQAQLGQGFQQYRTNNQVLRQALLSMAEEEGVQLGHEAMAVKMSSFMRTYQEGLAQMGNATGATGEPAS